MTLFRSLPRRNICSTNKSARAPVGGVHGLHCQVQEPGAPQLFPSSVERCTCRRCLLLSWAAWTTGSAARPPSWMPAPWSLPAGSLQGCLACMGNIMLMSKRHAVCSCHGHIEGVKVVQTLVSVTCSLVAHSKAENSQKAHQMTGFC